jgi:hypothetical protein
MNEEDYLIHLNYNLDYNLMLESAKNAEKTKACYVDPRYNSYKLNSWLISKFSNDYIEKILNDFEVDGYPRFYWLKANSVVPPHVDNDTKCSINFILSENPAPVNFNQHIFYYRQCLLNTSKIHWVKNGPTDRLLFKISIFDESFESLSKKIKFKLADNNI